MLSSLLRPKKPRQRVNSHLPFPPLDPDRRATADFTEDDGEDENTEDEEEQEDQDDEDQDEDQDDDDNEDEDEDEDDEDGDEDTPLLPIFSAAHLDALPVYSLTHAIRLIVLPRTETTLTWDQLRSPQVSQFLVKPMQQQIRTSYFSRATLYALMANCLQFQKEAQMNPGNAGTSRTRAMVCELLAIKLLKEYNTRELIDALSYDFFPLQGIAPEISLPGQVLVQKRPAAARISTLEVAIRASAKRFIAHPVVVRQLEAIWAGSIVFHSAADNLHRRRYSAPPTPPDREHQNRNPSCLHLLVPGQNVGYGSTNVHPPQSSPSKQVKPEQPLVSSRRTVTLYDPRDASLFKLSRLRVPRYRQFFSTCSLAILLGLFLAVLSARSTDITRLEILFWFWSAGFMLDEVVGFNEQGFSLYIMSFWNTFDLGILLFLVIYYLMRLYGIFLVDVGREQWNSMAYDVLATSAVLLFPRLFSVLDHYRYFSQLLIAFRLMAIDLVAVFILILIACSGFFVAFTLSFGKNEYDAAQVAYKIFQILMGFTPAAWEAWETYNPLGRALLILFLFICHFLVVTILITVLTNSFMSIVSNADQEHQFVFAVNTISMVKNDALFSYVAPTNIFAWILTPLRFLVPFRTFIKTNRNVIKATHFPLLLGIYAYEKLFLSRSVFEPTDLVDNVKRGRKRIISFQDGKMSLFSPNVNIRLRQESVSGFQKDRALDEVFRLKPRMETLRGTPMGEVGRGYRQNVVSNWMDQSGVASPPQEQDHDIVDRLEARMRSRKATLRQRGISGTRSVASDPEEFMSSGGRVYHNRGKEWEVDNDEAIQSDADADGDDEGNDNTHDEETPPPRRPKPSHLLLSPQQDTDDEGYFRPIPQAAARSIPRNLSKLSSSASSKPQPPQKISPNRSHQRNMSTNTILYNPVDDTHGSSSISPPKSRTLTVDTGSRVNTGTHTPALASHVNLNREPKSIYTTTTKTKARPILPNRQNFQSVPNFPPLNTTASKPRNFRHRRSSLEALDLDIGSELGAVPSSFQTQMAMATGGLGVRGGFGGRAKEGDEGMMGRLMLARMKTLEEGFADILREVRGMRVSTAGNSSVEEDSVKDQDGEVVKGKGKGKEKGGRRMRSAVGATAGAGLGGVGDGVSLDGAGGVELKKTSSVVDFADQGVGDRGSEPVFLGQLKRKGSSL